MAFVQNKSDKYSWWRGWRPIHFHLCLSSCLLLCMCGPSVWTPTSVNMMRPTRKETRLTANRKSSRRFLRRNTSGYMSTTAVTRLSTHTNWRSSTGEKKRTRSIINHCFMEKKGSKLTLTFYFTWLSSPRKTIMMKKRAAQRGEKGIMVTARG